MRMSPQAANEQAGGCLRAWDQMTCFHLRLLCPRRGPSRRPRPNFPFSGEKCAQKNVGTPVRRRGGAGEKPAFFKARFSSSTSAATNFSAAELGELMPPFRGSFGRPPRDGGRRRKSAALVVFRMARTEVPPPFAHPWRPRTANDFPFQAWMWGNGEREKTVCRAQANLKAHVACLWMFAAHRLSNTRKNLSCEPCACES